MSEWMVWLVGVGIIVLFVGGMCVEAAEVRRVWRQRPAPHPSRRKAM